MRQTGAHESGRDDYKLESPFSLSLNTIRRITEVDGLLPSWIVWVSNNIDVKVSLISCSQNILYMVISMRYFFIGIKLHLCTSDPKWERIMKEPLGKVHKRSQFLRNMDCWLHITIDQSVTKCKLCNDYETLELFVCWLLFIRKLNVTSMIGIPFTIFLYDLRGIPRKWWDHRMLFQGVLTIANLKWCMRIE